MRKLLWMVCMGAFCASGAWAQGEAYRNPALSPAERADDLLGRLTLKEKVSLMVNSSPGVEHLGIKPYNWWSEALHGVARSGLATVYPITMGMASSFDEEAVKEVYATVSDEARAKYHEAHRHGRFGQMNEGLTFWTPNVNIFRDPRWGRGQEVTFRVNVENTGEREGAEVVQVYVRKEGDAGGPLKSLRGFRRVELKAGESREVVVPLPAGAFEFFSPATNTMEVEPGEYEVLYGNSSDTPEENRLTVELL